MIHQGFVGFLDFFLFGDVGNDHPDTRGLSVGHDEVRINNGGKGCSVPADGCDLRRARFFAGKNLSDAFYDHLVVGLIDMIEDVFNACHVFIDAVAEKLSAVPVCKQERAVELYLDDGLREKIDEFLESAIIDRRRWR